MKKILTAALFAAAAVCGNVAQATPSLSFVVAGDTQPYSLLNNSTSGEFLTRFVLDLSTITIEAPFCFDTVDGGACNVESPEASPFAPLGGSGALTGLTGPATVADGSAVLDLRFSDFNAGESFSWNIDIDAAEIISVFGADLIDARVTAYFSNGQYLIGRLGAVPGNEFASQFQLEAIRDIPREVPEPGTVLLMGIAGMALLLLRRKPAR